MKMGFRLIRRNLRGGKFYCVDTLTGKRASLGTRSEDEATQIVQAKNQALRQPVLNLSIAKAHLAGSESGIATRTWQNAFDAIIDTKLGETKIRWARAAREKAFDLIRGKIIVETHAELFLAVLKAGTVSTNVHLRKLHNFCLGMNWLPWPIIPKRQWPEVRYKEKRAITLKDHQSIITWETNTERRAFYEVAWHIGALQSDIAFLEAENVDWENKIISYERKKTGTVAFVKFGVDLEKNTPFPARSWAAFSVSPDGSRGGPSHRIQAALPRPWDKRGNAPLLPLCLGRTCANGGLPGALRPRGTRPQQQGRSPGLCKESQGHHPCFGSLRERKGGGECDGAGRSSGHGFKNADGAGGKFDP